MKKRYLLIEKNSGMYNNVVEWDVDNDNWTCPENLLPVLEENHQLSQYALVSPDNTVTQTTLASADIFDMFKTTLSDNWIKVDKEKNLAQPGFKYNSKLNAFTPPKPFESWVLNEETYQWNPPIPRPGDGKIYRWDEESKNWKELNN